MKFDCHLHSFRSRDSVNLPKTIIHQAKKKRINIAITDHDSIRSWKELTVLGQKAGVQVIPGEEVLTFGQEGNKSTGDIIGLFLNEFAKPGFYLDVFDSIKEQDGLIVVPHPFDFLRTNFYPVKKEWKKVDCIESFNSRCYSDSFNSKAKAFALLHEIPQTGGSDAHLPEEIGSAFVDIPKADSLEDAHKLLKKGKNSVHGKRSSVMVHVKTFFTKKGFFKPKNY